MHFGSDDSKIIVDDRHEHIDADEDDEQNEEREVEWTEQRFTGSQLTGIEFEQEHFEEHLCRVQETRTLPSLRAELEIEQHEKGHEDNREHARERDELWHRPAQGSRQELQTSIVLAQAQQFDRAEEAAERREEGKQIADVDHELKVHVHFAPCVTKGLDDACCLVPAYYVYANTRPRANDNAKLNVRPDLPEVRFLVTYERTNFYEHENDDEDEVDQRTGDRVGGLKG